MESRKPFYTNLKDVIESKPYKADTIPEKQKLIQAIDTQFKEVAKTLLLVAPEFEDEFADLRSKVRRQEEIINAVGKQVQ